MKIRTQVISPLGTFESDLTEAELTTEQLKKIKTLYAQSHELSYLSIQQGSKIIYFPAEVIRQSIIILHVLD